MIDDFIPYGRQQIDEDDIRAVIEVLRSDWLTTGPAVAAFEEAFAARCGVRHAVAVSSGTAALHAAAFALRAGPGDQVVVPALTFAATANAFVYQGADVVFADVDPDTLCVDVDDLCAKITTRTKALVAVDFAGLPAPWDTLREAARPRSLPLLADACHAVGGADQGRPVGSLADLSAFSFHPVKAFTTGEGGMVVTDDGVWADRMRTFRNHGIQTDFRQREQDGTWEYAMTALGYNYRLTDLACALGLSQMRKLDGWIERRRALAVRYDRAFDGHAVIRPQAGRAGARHAYHLYVVRLRGLGAEGRRRVFRAMRERRIGVNVHYRPVHLHPFYRERFGTGPGLCPAAEAAYAEILSLPLYPGLSEPDQDRVVEALIEAVGAP